MKRRYIWLGLLMFCIGLLSGCGSVKNTTRPGTAVFKATSIPAGVTAVAITLTKEDVVVKELLAVNISTRTAEGVITLAPGTWTMLVEAKDSAGTVIYTGTTQVDVISGQLSTITLALQPATGRVAITVIWPGETVSQIVFASNRDGNYEIYRMNPDGSEQVRLTTNTALDMSPAISPDGSQIAFISDRVGGKLELWVMNINGTNPRQLTTDGTRADDPTWSPDGTQIAYTSEVNGSYDIKVMNADGTHVVNLTNTSTRLEFEPDWSPDGRHISYTDQYNGASHVYVMPATGGTPIQLTVGTSWNGAAAWAPSGNTIVFISDRNNAGYQLWRMNADGSAVVQVTWATGIETVRPAWSPDGTAIAFQASRNQNQDIYTVAPDGTNEQRLTTASSFDAFPSWGL